jgi:membrane fusion protein, multidrug efflux system
MSELATEQPGREQETALPAAPPSAPKPRTNGLRWTALALIPLLGTVAFFVWRYYSARESTDDAQIDGRIHAVSARVAGTVLSVEVDDNEPVDAGAVLARIDPRDYEVARRRARADLAEAQATLQASRTDVPVVTTTSSGRLSGAEAGVREAQAKVLTADTQLQSARARERAARARVIEAQANLDRLTRDLERFKVLVQKDEISQQQYDNAASAVTSARAQLDAVTAQVADAEESVNAARSQVEREKAGLLVARAAVEAAGSAPEQVAGTRARAESAAARVEQMQALVAQAELNLEYTVVRAPVAGVVSKRSVEVGQALQVGQPVVAIVPLEHIWITANFKETQLRYMRPGQKAVITVDAYGDREYSGHVDGIGAATGARFSLLPPENSTGNFVKVVQRVPVRIMLDEGQDKEHLLRPGMSVIATVMTR